MSREDFEARLQRLGAQPRQQPERDKTIAEMTPRERLRARRGLLNRTFGFIVGFFWGLQIRPAFQVFDENLETIQASRSNLETLPADLLGPVMVFGWSSILLGLLFLIGLISLFVGKRWLGLWLVFPGVIAGIVVASLGI